MNKLDEVGSAAHSSSYSWSTWPIKGNPWEEAIDTWARWSIFIQMWPAITWYAIVGRE